jgi:hypothetical protein
MPYAPSGRNRNRLMDGYMDGWIIKHYTLKTYGRVDV